MKTVCGPQNNCLTSVRILLLGLVVFLPCEKTNTWDFPSHVWDECEQSVNMLLSSVDYWRLCWTWSNLSAATCWWYVSWSFLDGNCGQTTNYISPTQDTHTHKSIEYIKVKLKPKSNLGFICECIWVKPLCKSTITTKETLLRFTVVSFSGKLIFIGVQGHFYASIKIAIFKALRRPDTTWNFARSITRVSTHEHKHWEPCLCTQILLKREFLNDSR